VKNKNPQTQQTQTDIIDLPEWLKNIAADQSEKKETTIASPKVVDVPFEIPVRVLIADPVERHRTNYRRILAEEPDFQIVGEAENGVEAVALADRLQPQLVIFAVSMPGMSGIGAARTIHERHPLIRMICCARENDGSFMRSVMLAGGRDYLTLPIFRQEFIRTLARVSAISLDNFSSGEMNIRHLQIDLNAMDRPVINDPSHQLANLLLQEGNRILKDGEVVDPDLELCASLVLVHEDVRGIWWAATCGVQEVLATARLRSETRARQQILKAMLVWER
jgi:DNA-binding NarL/FixJ family response regulator